MSTNLPSKSSPNDLDSDIKTAELRIKTGEAELNEISTKIKHKELEKLDRTFSISNLNPLIIGIIAALIGFLSNLAATYYQGQNAVGLEREKVQSSLIIESIKTGDPDTAAKNLKFLIEAGLLRDNDNKIKQYLDKRNQIPVLPSASTDRIISERVNSLPPESSFRKVSSSVGEIESNSAICTAFLISDNQVLTTSLCVSDTPMNIKFGYLSEKGNKNSFKVENVDERDDELMYAILRVERNPGQKFGKIPISNGSGKILIGQEVVLIHHSNLAPLSISRGHLTGLSGNFLQYEADTTKGAAGAPVVNSFAELIGLHTGASSTKEGEMNKEGIQISKIVEKSPILQKIISSNKFAKSK